MMENLKDKRNNILVVNKNTLNQKEEIKITT
jgi:hypothetical protein